MLLLFSLTLFLSAALLFAVEPMFGRMVLPLLGGSPSVWNTVMVFYQAALLAGYAYAHALSRQGPPWWIGHLALMAAALFILPLHLDSTQVPPPGGNPVPWLLLTMTSTVGLPFFLLATTGPLLQKWFAYTGHVHARDPYFLYAASNVGSLLGLLAYPFVLEPRWTLSEQSRLWTAGYGLLLLLIGACAYAARRGVATQVAPGPAPDDAERGLEESVKWSQRMYWLVLAFVPSSLMLGVTTHLSTDLVALPLLWVIPLATYLLTFIIAFAKRPLISAVTASRLLIYAVLGVLMVLQSHTDEPQWLVVGLHLGALFAGGLTCHGLLAAKRPGVTHLTAFYLWVAAGGALGGVFNALLAPLIFRSVTEYPLVLVLTCLLAPVWPAAVNRRKGAPRQTDGRMSAVMVGPLQHPIARDVTAALVFTAVVGAAVLGWRVTGREWLRIEFLLLLAALCFPLFSFRRRPVRFALALGGIMLLSPMAGDADRRTAYAERSFFGIHRVQTIRTAEGTLRQLVHGTTVHGMQWVDPDRCEEPLGYYHRLGPAGQVFATIGGAPGVTTVAVAGLGTGTLSAYARPGQSWTYFEIDPAVIRIASNASWFCYLKDAPQEPRVVPGDARLCLATDRTRYDLLVLDAYTSDAIPVHLLTREAFQEYVTHLTSHGVLVLHLSNRFFDLEPVVGKIARDAGLSCRIRSDVKVSEKDAATGRVSSSWAVFARHESDLSPLTEDERWRPLQNPETAPLWTDSYSSLVSVLR